MKKIIDALQMIKIEHTVFAMPFAIIGMLLAGNGWPSGRVIFLVLVAFTSARAAAMTFNRIVDLQYDRENPRTRERHLPRGILTHRFAWMFFGVTVIIFEISCFFLNTLCLILSPLALGIILFYSMTKRFTHYSHFVLGLSLACAPIGAGVAVSGHFIPTLFILSAMVLFWVAGFDILYATQDYDFDRTHGLYSVCVRYGIENALRIAFISHTMALGFLLWFAWGIDAGPAFSLGTALSAMFFLYEHAKIQPDDLSKVPLVFFAVNGWVSLMLMGLFIMDFRVFHWLP